MYQNQGWDDGNADNLDGILRISVKMKGIREMIVGMQEIRVKVRRI